MAVNVDGTARAVPLFVNERKQVESFIRSRISRAGVIFTALVIKSSAVGLGDHPIYEGVTVTREQRATIEDYVRGYLDPAFWQGPWFEHHLRMNFELYSRELEKEPALKLAEFLGRAYSPVRAKRRR